MKYQRRQGFTVVELLTVLTVIAILVGILIPTVSFVRNTARTAKQTTQLATIDMAIMAFKGDHGYYPPSDWRVPNGYYCGAQKLAVALVGQDLLGFHPDTSWAADDLGGVYNLGGMSEAQKSENLNKRTGPYLELTTANAFKLDSLFYNNTSPLDPNTFVLCDSFGAKNITVGTKTVTVGTPILYFRANTSSKLMSSSQPWDGNIYSLNDNLPLIGFGSIKDGKTHPLGGSTVFYSNKTGGLIDPKITAVNWPYRPDSYILISAGVDGLYGTSDDITNF